MKPVVTRDPFGRYIVTTISVVKRVTILEVDEAQAVAQSVPVSNGHAEFVGEVSDGFIFRGRIIANGRKGNVYFVPNDEPMTDLREDLTPKEPSIESEA